MKNKRLLLLIGLLALAGILYFLLPGPVLPEVPVNEKRLLPAPGGKTDMDPISNAVAMGNAELLTEYFAEEVELVVEEEEDIYTRQEAQEIIEKFFQKYPVSSYRILHNGESSSGEHTYMIGRYRSPEAVFRIYIGMQGDQVLEFKVELDDSVSI